MRENVPLARLTSFAIGGPARYFIEPRNRQELIAVTTALSGEGIQYRVIGAGTNILVSDEGFPGAVIRLAGDFAALGFEGARVTAGAAAPLARLVREAAERGLAGAEGLVGIPGSVGGALLMNAGGRWGRMDSIVDTVMVLVGEEGSASGELRELTRADMRFGYRESSLHGTVILAASFILHQDNPRQVLKRTNDLLAEKKASQDFSAKSAGCIFKNPPSGPSAGALIDKAGLKGTRVGGAEVSAVHANFITNADGATAAQVLELINLVRERVSAQFQVDLELEIELW